MESELRELPISNLMFQQLDLNCSSCKSVLENLAECFLKPRLVDRSKQNIRNSLDLASAELSAIVVSWFLWSRTEVDLDLSYLVSFDSEEFRVPGSAASLGFAVVENEGFVVLFKHLLNLIGWGLLAIGPAAFEVGFAVNAMVVRTGKYEVVAQ
jgi:hypothetical protein